MGKGEERNGTTAQAGESTFLAKSSNEASKMLEAALLQMDDIISGTNVTYGYQIWMYHLYIIYEYINVSVFRKYVINAQENRKTDTNNFVLYY